MDPLLTFRPRFAKIDGCYSGVPPHFFSANWTLHDEFAYDGTPFGRMVESDDLVPILRIVNARSIAPLIAVLAIVID